MLFGIVFALLFAGLAGRRGEILSLSMPVLAYLLTAMLTKPRDARLRLDRSLSPRSLTEGEKVLVQASLENAGKRALHIRYRVPEGPLQSVLIAPGEVHKFEYSLTARRGKRTLPGMDLSVSDIFGLFEETFEFTSKEEFIARPRYEIAPVLPLRPRRTMVFAGQVAARIGGSGTDFFGVRPWRAHDSLRHVNWKQGARHGGMFTNEFEQERVADVGLVLDARFAANRVLGDEALFDFSARATATLAKTFLDAGNRVGLLAYGRVLDWLPPGFGRTQFEMIMRKLGEVVPGEHVLFEELRHLPARLFPPESQIVWISPLLPSDGGALARLRQRGYAVLVVSPDPVSFEARGLADTEDVRMAARIARRERRLLVSNLAGAGIPTVDWDTARSLRETILAGPAAGNSGVFYGAQR